MSDGGMPPTPRGEILIVEGKVPDLKFMSESLTKAGYRVRAAGDGETALRSLLERLPDLILLDLKLPGEDGVQVCRAIKHDPATSGVPVVFTSAVGDVELRVQALEAGAIDYVTRPFQLGEVLARVETHVNLCRLKRRLSTQTIELAGEVETRKRAEAELRASEMRHQTMMEHLPSVLWTCDENGVTSLISANVQRVYGYSAEEVYAGGADLWLGEIHPEDAEQVKHDFAELMNNGAPFDIEYRIRHKDGRWIWLHDVAKKVMTVDAERRAFGVFTDISDRKRAQEELAIERENLEVAVRKRTTELQKTINLMAGRENRMAQLKRMAARLRAQLKEHGIEPVGGDPSPEGDDS